jgi:hypothetical protein
MRFKDSYFYGAGRLEELDMLSKSNLSGNDVSDDRCPIMIKLDCKDENNPAKKYCLSFIHGSEDTPFNNERTGCIDEIVDAARKGAKIIVDGTLSEPVVKGVENRDDIYEGYIYLIFGSKLITYEYYIDTAERNEETVLVRESEEWIN